MVSRLRLIGSNWINILLFGSYFTDGTLRVNIESASERARPLKFSIQHSAFSMPCIFMAFHSSLSDIFISFSQRCVDFPHASSSGGGSERLCINDSMNRQMWFRRFNRRSRNFIFIEFISKSITGTQAASDFHIAQSGTVHSAPCKCTAKIKETHMSEQGKRISRRWR